MHIRVVNSVHPVTLSSVRRGHFSHFSSSSWLHGVTSSVVRALLEQLRFFRSGQLERSNVVRALLLSQFRSVNFVHFERSTVVRAVFWQSSSVSSVHPEISRVVRTIFE